MAGLRGLEEKHEHGAQEMVRDTRPLGQRIGEFFANPLYVCIMLGTAIAAIVIMPSIADLLTIISIFIVIFALTRKQTLPFKLPKTSGVADYNDVIPGTTKPRKAQGIALFGNEKLTNKELWFSNDDMRTHVLMFGSTGSGKTEALVSIAFNALIQGSGFIYVDGKGDNSLYAKVFSMTRRMGREDDLLLINFMTGARDILGPQKTRLSNTMNPFALGSSSMLSQLIVSLMDSGSSSGDGDMWKGRAISFVEALMKVLVAMRDEGHILLDANIIRSYFILEKLEQIVVDRRFPISETESIPLDGIPQVVLDGIDNYIFNLPGYNRAKKGNQAGEVREQHGFITMQLTRVFSSLADTYGHIIRTNLAEVEMKDVVLNRRILVVLLPALEKAPEELMNLGKIIVASLKAMMAAGLGDEVEGSYRDVILRKPTNSPTPYLCILDEYGYYAVKGFAVVPAQARSLGFAAVFAGQDLPAFQKASKEEAASIGANTNVKICMKLEDPADTWEFFNKTAGETYATSVSGFQTQAGSMTTNYLDTRNASIEKRQRIDLLDLKDQREGDAHIFYRSKIVRARMFYANPKPAKHMQLNQFVCIEKPSDQKLMNLDKRIRRYTQIFNAPQFVMDPPPLNDDISVIAQSIVNYQKLKPFERSIAAMIGVLEQEVQKQRSVRAEVEAEQAQEFQNEVHAFTPVYLPEVAISIVGEENVEKFSNPLLLKGRTTEALMHIERLAGADQGEAAKRADNLVHDIIKSTYYPPDIRLTKDVPGVFEAIKKVYKDFTGHDLPELSGVEDAQRDEDEEVE